MEVTIGGERLGSGNKNKQYLHNYERSTHNLDSKWRSSMAPGTLVPFYSMPALPGDAMDIELDTDVMTLPTIGPLFGSYKVQLDMFLVPQRLYQGDLHMNRLNVGMNMESIKLPLIDFQTRWLNTENLITGQGGELQQVNPSCILKYLGISGAGRLASGSGPVARKFNAIPYLAYWDIYKQYYSNKQEQRGFAISNAANQRTITAATVNAAVNVLAPANPSVALTATSTLVVTFNGPPTADTVQRILVVLGGTTYQAISIFNDYEILGNVVRMSGVDLVWQATQTLQVPALQLPSSAATITLQEFDLENIDTMRENILKAVGSGTAYIVDASSQPPYNIPLGVDGEGWAYARYGQTGLGLKTYQSDLFNNWVDTEFIDGVNGINEITAVSTTGDEFTIDALNLASKVYVMLNRIALSGGTYDDWLDAVYTHERPKSVENPMYLGSLIKELAFEEVISTAEQPTQPLGTLAGRGRLTQKHKGGRIRVEATEPSYVIGIVSITPRVDYSQGNKWDVNIRTMDDWHKPALDQIGYQDLITDQLAWWDTRTTAADVQTFNSAGKQPAWLNYMTEVDRTFGNFADESKEMFMTLNRRYDFSATGAGDITTYIDPTKFNQIFADTALDSQNFWVQIAIKNTARRKISAKQIPNL